LLVAPVTLVAIVAIAVAGRGARPVPAEQPAVPAIQAAVASLPAATPSPRSDWPAALANRNPAAERVNKFTIDDVRTGWSASDDAPPWSRRLGGLTNYRTHRYER
jgi:hypothetical protein